MIKSAFSTLIFFVLLFTGLFAHAVTDIWMNNDRTVITVKGDAFDWDGINLYEALNVAESYSHLDGVSVGMKELSYISADGATVLDIFCSEASGGIDIAHCFITLERSMLTWFDESSQQAIFTLSNPYEANQWAKNFSGMNSAGQIYSSYDGRLNIFAGFENGRMNSFQIRYIP